MKLKWYVIFCQLSKNYSSWFNTLEFCHFPLYTKKNYENRNDITTVTSWKWMQSNYKSICYYDGAVISVCTFKFKMELLYMVNSIQDHVSFRTLFKTLKQLRKPTKNLNQNSYKSEYGISKIWSKSADKCMVIFGVILPFYKCELQGEERRETNQYNCITSPYSVFS